MGLTAIYLGHTTWPELLSHRHGIATFERALAEGAAHDQSVITASCALRMELDEADHQLAIEAGLGAMPAFAEPLTATRYASSSRLIATVL